MKPKPAKENITEKIRSFSGQFNSYQAIAPCVLDAISNDIQISYNQKQIPLDEPRFRWITKNVDVTGRNVFDLGANLGYFSLRLASEFDALVYACEPISQYAELLQLFVEVCDLEEQLQVSQASIAMSDLDRIPETDLFLHLNVLHHAGVHYDRNLINNVTSWRRYAQDYLWKLAEKTSYLIIQFANVWNGQVLFDSAETIPFIYELLSTSGWEIEKIGAIYDFEALTYETFVASDYESMDRVSIMRNKNTNLVEYTINKKHVASFPTGLAQRPLWLCRSRG